MSIVSKESDSQKALPNYQGGGVHSGKVPGAQECTS